MDEEVRPDGWRRNDTSDEVSHRKDLTEEALAELRKLEGKTVVGVSLYEDSTLDEDEEPVAVEARIDFDADLYLIDQTLLSLYGATAYPATDDSPLKGADAISEALGELAEKEDTLRQVRRDESGRLALDFGPKIKRHFLLVVKEWSLDRWDELPEDEEEFGEEDWQDSDEEDQDDWDDDDLDMY